MDADYRLDARLAEISFGEWEGLTYEDVLAANATMQLGIEPTMRGRVMALYMTVLMGGTPIGSPFIGWVGQEFGARWSLIVGGGLTMLGTTASVLYFSRRRGLAIRPRLLPRPRLEVLPQTELLGEKATADVGPRVA